MLKNPQKNLRNLKHHRSLKVEVKVKSKPEKSDEHFSLIPFPIRSAETPNSLEKLNHNGAGKEGAGEKERGYREHRVKSKCTY